MNALTAPSNVAPLKFSSDAQLTFAPTESDPEQFLNRLRTSVAPPAPKPEDAPSPVHARLLGAVAVYQTKRSLSDELRQALEQTIAEADLEHYRGGSTKIQELEAVLTELSRQLRDNFPRRMRNEAQRLKNEIDLELESVPAAQQYCYRLCSELLVLANNVREKLNLLSTLKQINASCAQKTQLLNELTAPALILSNRYERVRIALEMEQNLPARIRYAYAQMLADEAGKMTQDATLVEGTAEHRQARQLLREAAYGDRTLLRDESFLAFAKQLGSTDLIQLSEQGDD